MISVMDVPSRKLNFMDNQTLKRLEAAGFVPTTVAESLGLSPAEEALVETKLRFTILLKQTRTQRGWTQAQLANALETTQQTVARAERGGASVSLDFLLRALVTLGLSLADLGDELHALDAVLHPAAAACHSQSACAETQAMSERRVEFKLLEKENLVSPEKVAAAAQTTAPMLSLIRGGFSGTPLKAGGARQWSPPAFYDADRPLLVATG